MITYVGNIFNKNKEVSRVIRDTDLITSLQEFIMSNWSTNRYFNIQNPNINFLNYTDTPYWYDSNIDDVVSSLKNSTITYRGVSYYLTKDGLKEITVDDKLSEIPTYDKEIIDLSYKILDKDINSLDNDELKKLRENITKILPIINTYGSEPKISYLIDELIKIISIINSKLDIKEERKTYKEDWDNIYKLLKDYDKLIKSIVLPEVKVRSKDDTYSKVPIQRLSYLFLLNYKVNKLLMVVKNHIDNNERSILLENMVNHINHTFKKSIEHHVYKNMIIYQKYCMTVSEDIDSEASKNVDMYIHYYNTVLDSKIVEDVDLLQDIIDNHEKAKSNLYVSRKYKELMSKSNNICLKLLGYYIPIITELSETYYELNDNSDIKVKKELLDEIRYVKYDFEKSLRPYKKYITNKVYYEVNMWWGKLNNINEAIYNNIKTLEDNILKEKEMYNLVSKHLETILLKYVENPKEVSYLVKSVETVENTNTILEHIIVDPTPKDYGYGRTKINVVNDLVADINEVSVLKDISKTSTGLATLYDVTMDTLYMTLDNYTKEA